MKKESRDGKEVHHVLVEGKQNGIADQVRGRNMKEGQEGGTVAERE